MMKRIRLLLLVLAGLLILSTGICGSGCVKSEASPIYSENSTAGSGEEGSGQTAVPAGRYEAPEHWTDSVSKDDLSVEVDAKVTVPDAENFPVTVMSAEVEISQETADLIRKTLLGDAELYWNIPPVSLYTKQDIQNRIDIFTSEMDTPEGKKNSEEYQDAIDTLEDMYEDAPATFEPGPAETQFREYTMFDITHSYKAKKIYGTVAVGDDGEEAYFDISTGEIHGVLGGFVNFHAGFFDIFDNADLVWNPSHLDGIPQNEDEVITVEQAEEKAIAAVRAMGLDYLEIADMKEQTIIEHENDTTAAPSGIRPCYTFTLKRSIGGIVENAVYSREFRIATEKDYEKRDLFTETARITVAKEGIIDFIWSDPGEVVRTESENVELLSFDEMREVFNNQIILDNLQSELDILIANYELNVLSRSITIEEARLGLMCVSRQVEGGGYLMIPVWDFYGYESLKLADPEIARAMQLPINENGEFDNRIQGKSYLTLNAVDGSVINRTLGY